MSAIKNELSLRNEYYLPRHRYLELKHFCLQYKDWEKELKYASFLRSTSFISGVGLKDGRNLSRTEAIVILQERATKNITLIHDAMKATTSDKESQLMLYEGITTGAPYDKMMARGCLPVLSRSAYYKLYRRFFWELSQIR